MRLYVVLSEQFTKRAVGFETAGKHMILLPLT
jgi:hypothetical protein